MECKVCGRKLFRTQKFCPDCGTKVEENATAIDNPVDAQKEEKQSLIEELEVMKGTVDKKVSTPTNETPKADVQGPQPVEPQVKKKSDSYAIAGFVLSLCGIFGVYIGLICGILGIIFSAISMKESKQRNLPKNKLAIAGLIIAIVLVSFNVLDLMTMDYYLYY